MKKKLKKEILENIQKEYIDVEKEKIIYKEQKIFKIS